jgi:sulfite reductase (NADPH) flavoprotein alpha-component
MMTIDPIRWASALAMLAAYGLMCMAIVRAQRAKAGANGTGAADWLVAFASQTGTGEFLAQRTLATLRTGGLSARAVSLEHLDAAQLHAATRILFIASTYGEGDAPDSAARFVRLLDDPSLNLAQLRYAVLALGDSNYAHYCGFGRALDAALQARGAHPLFARIDVDRVAPAAVEAWQHHLSHLAGTSDAPDWSAPDYGNWRIASRVLVNPGSAGAPVYRIALTPAQGALPEWQAGDLVQLSAPGDPDYPREYSIASVHAEGHIELLVRLHLREDGNAGVASGWLCLQATEQDRIALRVRQHNRFRLGDNAGRPLILIGNGTGMAGLRAHLKARADARQARNWLVFGERQAQCDYFYRDEIAAWQRDGAIETLNVAFSRDGAAVRYVQHALALEAERLRHWVADGAAVYVCGSLHGMAAGVHDTLVAALGQAGVEQLDAAGRYRRDVY